MSLFFWLPMGLVILWLAMGVAVYFYDRHVMRQHVKQARARIRKVYSEKPPKHEDESVKI